MAAGKNGWKCGVVLKMTLICLICMTLFHSGDSYGKEDACNEVKALFKDTGNDAEKFGQRLGETAIKKPGKHKDGLLCLEGINLYGENNGCKIEVDVNKVNTGIEKAGGGTVCESKKCVFFKDAIHPVCGGPKSNSSQIQAMVLLIASVLLVGLYLHQMMSCTS